MKTFVLTFWLVADAMFVAAAPPPPRTGDVIRRSEAASGTATNVTVRDDGRAPKRRDKKRIDVPCDFSTEEAASIFRIAREYRPEGIIIPTAVLQRGPLPDTAVVRITAQRGGREEVVCVLTLKKEGKEWKVESCAR